MIPRPCDPVAGGGKMATMPTTYPKISFCTVCMGRLHHLRQTLPQNLADNADYPNLEWVILDYHSQDGLGDWIRTELAEEWESGRIRYWRTTEPEAFHRCHSRNLLFRQAEGDVLVNLDADNFTGPGFAHYVGQQFANHPKAYLVPDTVRLEHLKDAVGRVCVRKEHFMAVRGYDEAMEGYGFEDHDLYARLDALGLQRLPIDREAFLRYLPHSDRERVENEARWRSMKTMYRLPRQRVGQERVLILGWDQQYVMSALESSEPSETGSWRERSG
ncbi:MAG: glycosyltransferase family A protein, partial [Bacteroidota bacterium]